MCWASLYKAHPSMHQECYAVMEQSFEQPEPGVFRIPAEPQLFAIERDPEPLLDIVRLPFKVVS